MGVSSSKQDRTIEELPGEERYFGLENFGNTCYCNSVLQALYFCVPFRERVLAYAAHLQAAIAAGRGPRPSQENMLTCLAELFAQISSQKKKVGSVAPRRLVGRVKAESSEFSSYMHQDAHEFLNWLLNNLSDVLEREERVRAAARSSRPGSRSGSRSGSPTKARSPSKAAAPGAAFAPLAGGAVAAAGGSPTKAGAAAIAAAGGSPTKAAALGAAGQQGGGTSSRPSSRSGSPTKARSRSASLQNLQAAGAAAAAASKQPVRTWVQDLFQGRLVNETRCLQCNTVTCREEEFYELNLEIQQNSSLTACLKQFSSVETLDKEDKFFCDKCNGLQEAQKRMRLKHLPPMLCLHLKRFKYMEQAGRLRKLMHRVVFPFELKLWNTTPDCPDADASYHLFAVVVHMGAHINHGHYVALVKSQGQWICFDDDQVLPITEAQVQSTFGHTQEPLIVGDTAMHADHVYMLFYQRQQQQVPAAAAAAERRLEREQGSHHECT